eukprot:3571685-Pyramimonas_sp.AAC.1
MSGWPWWRLPVLLRRASSRCELLGTATPIFHSGNHHYFVTVMAARPEARAAMGWEHLTTHPPVLRAC